MKNEYDFSKGGGGWVGTECRKSCNLLGVMWHFFFFCKKNWGKEGV